MKVFISCASDDREIAKKLYDDLCQSGISPWMETEDLLAGEKTKKIIYRKIKESSYFLALLSSRSVSERGYFQKELKMALNILDEFPDNEIFIIPVYLDDCKPVDQRLDELKPVDFFPSYEKGLKQILRVTSGSDIEKEASDIGKLSVFLANTPGLYKEYNEVRRYIDQAGFKVLPEKTLFPCEPDIYKEAVEKELETCSIFIQLLSDMPYRIPPDLTCYSRIQLECAKSAGIEVMQWHNVKDINTIEDEYHRNMLKHAQFSANKDESNLEEFKRQIVMKGREIEKLASKSTSNMIVFLNVHNNNKDHSWAKKINEFVQVNYNDIDCDMPIENGEESVIFEDFQESLLYCNGVIVVYGQIDEIHVKWVRKQLRECRKVMYEREYSLKTAIYECPPQQKPSLNIGFRSLHIIDGRTRFNEKEIQYFLDDLRGERNS